jgi:hypothetical protein
MTKKSAAQEIRFFGKIGFLKINLVSKKSDFLEKSDFSNRAQTCPKNDKEIRCPRNPIFWKNRISQTNRVPKHTQKMTKKSVSKKSDCPRNPIFWKNRISQTNRVPKHAQKKCDAKRLASGPGYRIDRA